MPKRTKLKHKLLSGADISNALSIIIKVTGFRPPFLQKPFILDVLTGTALIIMHVNR